MTAHDSGRRDKRVSVMFDGKLVGFIGGELVDKIKADIKRWEEEDARRARQADKRG